MSARPNGGGRCGCVIRLIIMRCHGGGIYHGDSATVAEPASDLAEVVYESPDAHSSLRTRNQR